MSGYFSRAGVLLGFFLLLATTVVSQKKGSLFIIGGGERPPELLDALVKTANLQAQDYIVILTMASGVPDESFQAIKAQLAERVENFITEFHFTKEEAENGGSKVDSVRNARLIYVVGGDQNRFMDVVRGTPLFTAMHQAYDGGAVIAGTSAGAAIMSQIMITGSRREAGERSDFRAIKRNDVVTSEGMGFITGSVIDQHFIMRSRYNRLMSVLVDHPDKMVIGIDESTAIIVQGRKAKVVGNSQVWVVAKPGKIKYNGAKEVVGFKKSRMSLYTPGDSFKIKQG